ncbi:DNA/RNA helicase domain-containing protein [Filimonas effusa]|uniref:DNA/RNA helicase domain-containing protein n=1 Tax=Filimonas effusa TaxID=2508721 RepID=UPI001C701622|nr:DNA/RNA helicase domain-containing protein [Filimonas effusa]
MKKEEKKLPLAYVGETADAISRLTKHLAHPDKVKLEDTYFFYGNKFNKSATLDIESGLIRYLSGDGKYKLLNANLGLVDHNYYQRDELYQEIFKAIWEELRALKICRKTLSDIDNSPLFKYSPYKALSPEQTKNLIFLLEAIANNDKKRFVIQGGAGSGKSILAIFLFKLLHTSEEDFNFGTFKDEDYRIIQLVKDIKQANKNLKMALVIPMDSFRATVKSIFKHVKGLGAEMVVGPADLRKNNYDIIIVDEAHRLRRRVNLGPYFGVFDSICEELHLDKNTASEVDWILKQSCKSIFFYDAFQSVKPSDALPEQFDELMNNKEETGTGNLISQFRVRGGLPYVAFIDELLLCKRPQNEPKFFLDEYELSLFHDVNNMVDHIKKKEEQEGLARIIAGYAWPWPSQQNKTAYDIFIGETHLRWNSVKRDWINSANAINEVGCIHTVQGYDLNYAGIILGNEIGYDKEKNEIIIRKEHYFDANGKNGIKEPELLKKFILNIYKTLMLRGMKGTYLYVCDEALRNYFSRHIPWHDEATSVEEDTSGPLIPFVNSVPLYNLEASAGGFSDLQQVTGASQLYPVPQDLRITREHFACKVVGESMNKRIPNGAICLFRKYDSGSRNGEIVLASHIDIQDADYGANYTVKKYYSKKVKNKETGTWQHESITLMPLSTDETYENIELKNDETAQFTIHGIFEEVLSP